MKNQFTRQRTTCSCSIGFRVLLLSAPTPLWWFEISCSCLRESGKAVPQSRTLLEFAGQRGYPEHSLISFRLFHMRHRSSESENGLARHWLVSGKRGTLRGVARPGVSLEPVRLGAQAGLARDRIAVARTVDAQRYLIFGAFGGRVAYSRCFAAPLPGFACARQLCPTP